MNTCCLILALFFAKINPFLPNDSLFHTKEINITADSVDKQPIAPIFSLSPETIQAISALQLSDAVRFLPGSVIVRDYGGISGMKTISLRGLAPPYTDIFLDGVPFKDNSTGITDLGKIILSQNELISLSFGFSQSQSIPTATELTALSVLSTSSHSQHDSSKNKTSLTLTTSARSFNSFSANASLSHSNHNAIQLSASMNALYSLGDFHYSIKNGETLLHLLRKNNDIKQGQLALSLNALPSNSSKLQFRLAAFVSDKGLPSSIITDNYENSRSRLFTADGFAQVSFQTNISSNLVLATRAKYSLSTLSYQDPLAVPKSIHDRLTQHEGFINAGLNWTPFSFLEGFVTTDMQINILNNTQYLYHPFRVASLSALGTRIEIEKLRIETFATASYFINGHNQLADASQRVSILPGGIAVSFSPIASFEIQSFFKWVTREPSFNELYYQRFGNQNIKPENTKHISATLSYTYQSESWLKYMNVSLTGFFIETKDKILSVPKDAYSSSVQNIGLVETIGGTFFFNAKASAHVFRMEVFGEATFLVATDKSPNSSTFGQQISYTPYFTAKGKVLFAVGFMTLNILYDYSGGRFFLPENIQENYLQPYMTLDVNIASDVVLSDIIKAEVKIEVKNITGTDYEIIRGFPMTKQNFSLGLKCFINP